MKLELTTDLLPVLNVGMYNSELSPDNIFDFYNVSEKGQNQFWDQFNNDKYQDMVFKQASNILKTEVLPYLKSLDVGITDAIPARIKSPKYYNYGTDELYFDIIIEDFDKITAALNKLSEQEVKDRFVRSGPGFCSFMPQSIEEIIKEFDTEPERAFSAALRLILDREKLHDFQYDLLEAVISDNWAPEYCNDHRKIRTFKKEYMA